MKIKHELKNRGVSSDLIDSLIDFNSQDWLEIAFREYQKKFGHRPSMDTKERAKRIRFLQSRGFTSDIIQQTLDTYSSH